MILLQKLYQFKRSFYFLKFQAHEKNYTVFSIVDEAIEMDTEIVATILSLDEIF